MNLSYLLNHRIIFVTGKGGVGKSTISAAIGTIAAKHEKKTLIVEFSGQCSMHLLLGGKSAGYEIIERKPNLYTLSITPEESMEEYLIRELHSKTIYNLIFKNSYISPFIAAVPGLEDLMSVGKVMDLERSADKTGKPIWDIIIVDAPSTGQGINLFRVPQAMMAMTKAGPFYNSTKLIHDVISNPEKTSVILATLPEEMPVNETIDMFNILKNQISITPSLAIINQERTAIFSPDESKHFSNIKPSKKLSSHVQKAIYSITSTAIEMNKRISLEQSHINKLKTQIQKPILILPSLPRRCLAYDDIETLSKILENNLQNA